jgi:hypothetical protein
VVEHATHVYNRTPLRCHNWQTPYKLLYGEKPSIDHLRIFGCGAYVFIPAKIQANKLAPKSEIVTYLGNAPNAGGFMFMKAPNNVIFYTTHCIFDESMFPRCNKVVKKPLTRLLKALPLTITTRTPFQWMRMMSPQDVTETSREVLESSPLKKG